MNYDIESYVFEDLDLEIAADTLKGPYKVTLILYLMGFSQEEIAALHGLTRSAICKRLITIETLLRGYLLNGI